VRRWVGPNTCRHSDVPLTPEEQFLGRPPVVKRHTTPRSGFFPFSRCVGPGAVIRWPRF
jgi:hypothetical protein